MSNKILYGLPKKVLFCKKCVISNQTPNSTQEFRQTLKSKKKTTFIDKKGISDPWKYSSSRRRLIGKKEKKNF